MGDQPWMKFYPRDWRGDQALRAVSIAARGLWIECLCIMHEANPRGHLLLNGVPVEDSTLARMAGVSVDEIRFLMDELRQAGVSSVTRNGVIFSRRMTKDHARAQKGKAAVKKRKDRQKSEDTDCTQAPDAKQKSGAPNRYPSRIPSTQKPEARSQSKKEEAYASSKKKRGTRIKEDWVLPKDWGDWALSQGWPEHAIRLEADKFHDHWKAAPGQKGVKLDWQATWRNWMRNSKSPKNRKFGDNDPTTTDPTLDAIAIAARMRRTSR